MDSAQLTNGHRSLTPDYMPRSPGSRRSSTPDGRRASLTGEPSDMEMMQLAQEAALLPLKEDLADWLTKTLDIEVSVENFMDALDSGVHLCRLAHIIQVKSEEALREGLVSEGLSPYKLKCKQNARSGTWFARDNIANFLTWCRNCRVKEECIFETEGLVSHRGTRNVVLCLLELARIGHKFGLDPPSLIKLEKEIEKEEEEVFKIPAIPHETARQKASSSSSTSSTPSPKPQRARRPSSAGRARKKSTSSASSSAKSSLDDLDKEVRKISSVCNCSQCYQVERLAEGRYMIGGKIVFVRLLKQKHVMVRVGGGWDTLEHYIETHDPCKSTDYKRSTTCSDQTNNDKFLCLQGRYKSVVPSV